MGAEQKGRITIIEPVQAKHFTAFDIYLDNGTRITLPPVGYITINQLKPGDNLRLSPHEATINTRIIATRDKKRVTSFIVGNEYIMSPQKTKIRK